jgi:hypothetical protein
MAEFKTMDITDLGEHNRSLHSELEHTRDGVSFTFAGSISYGGSVMKS